ncbi:MAG: winged helix DNA-binding domain-containing protein [Anaerolineales bacterium]
MPKQVSSEISVNWDQVAAFRLTQHHLLKQASKKSLLAVADDMTGAQAQLVSAAYLSLQTRIHGLELNHIEDAFRTRMMVKASGMRRTLFLYPSETLAVFVRGSARRAQKEYNWARRKGASERDLDAAIHAALSVLDQPLTRPEIAERACKVLGVETRFVKGGGWGSNRELASVPVGELTYPVVYFLHLAASRGIICYGPYQGNEPTFVRADAWIPDFQDMSQEQAEGLLLRKYLHAFGPATAADFSMWSGLSLRDVQGIWQREESDFITVDVDGWKGTVLRQDVKKLTKAEVQSPSIRLLPYFDTFLLGHRERTHLVAREHHGKIYRPQGWISPVVLVNGRVVALWGHVLEKGRLHVTVQKFVPVSRHVRTGILEEAEDLARFLGATEVDVQIR